MEAVAHKPWRSAAPARSRRRFRFLVAGESPAATLSLFLIGLGQRQRTGVSALHGFGVEGADAEVRFCVFPVECIAFHPFRNKRGKDGAPSASVDGQRGRLGQPPSQK